MAIEHVQRTRHSLVSSVYYRTMDGLGKVFKIEVIRQLKNDTLNLIFANNRDVLLIFNQNLQKVC